MTTEAEIFAEPQLPPKATAPNLLKQGFSLVLRHWPFVVLDYAINLIFALLAGIPVASGVGVFLDHSLAGQRIAGTLDLSILAELELHLRETHLMPIALRTAAWLDLLQLLLLLTLFAGTLAVFVSGEPPHMVNLVRGGIANFWRFVRATLMAGAISGLILGILLAIRSALLAKLAQVHTEGTLFTYAIMSGAVVFLAAMVLRLWFDLVEVYVVRHAMVGELRVRRSLLPAWRLLVRFFFRLFGGFLLAGFAGAGALGLCLFLWKALPGNQVWLAALLAQMGLFLLLASRFWQRGLETVLVLAVDPPVVALEEVVTVHKEEEAISLEGVAGISGLSEPTLSELVQKLRTEPWTMPVDNTAPSPMTSEKKPESAGQVAVLPEIDEVAEAKRKRHAAKFPLGGAAPDQEPPPPDPPGKEDQGKGQ